MFEKENKVEFRLFAEMANYYNHFVDYYDHDASDWRTIPLGINSKKSAELIQDMIDWKKHNWSTDIDAERNAALFVYADPILLYDKFNEVHIHYGTPNWKEKMNFTVPDEAYFFNGTKGKYFSILRRISSWHKKKYTSGIIDYFHKVNSNKMDNIEVQCLLEYLRADDYLTVYKHYGEKIYRKVIGTADPYVWENQFVYEATHMIENELYKMFTEMNEDIGYADDRKLKSEIQLGAYNKFEEMRQMLHDYRFTF